MKIQVELAHSPRYASADGTMIDLDVKFSHLNMTVPFTANANDVEPHCSDLFNRAVAGEFGPVAPYVAPEPVVDPAVMAKQKHKDDAIKDAKNAALSLNTRIDAILQMIDAK